MRPVALRLSTRPAALRCALLLILGGAALIVPAVPENRGTDPLTLLGTVSNRYAQVTSYHIEAIKERTTTNELEHNWEKIRLTAIVGPNGRYRYEARTGHGSAILVSDGKINWNYHLDEHLYTQIAASVADTGKKRVFSEEEMNIPEAKQLVTEIRTLATYLKSAKLLPDKTIDLNGRKVDCYVVSFANTDFKIDKANLNTQETVWIAKSGNIVVKTYKKSDTYVIIGGSNAHIPMVSEETVTYPVVEFDEEPESSFSFRPPAEAKLVESFPRLQPHRGDNNPVLDLIGKTAPEVSLKDPNGKVTSLSAFRGKPIFIEFWATWCGPCVGLFPELKKLYEETAPNGLVWISVDNDDDPSMAASFLSQEHLPWPNYHDGDGALGKAFGRQGIPMGVLIDAAGNVTFYKSGYDISELRSAIAKLAQSETLPRKE